MTGRARRSWVGVPLGFVGLALTLVVPRPAAACSCVASIAYPDATAPPNTLIFIEAIEAALPTSVSLQRADDESVGVATSIVLSASRFVVARPERLLEEGEWEIFADGRVGAFEVVAMESPAPEVPVVTSATGEGSSNTSCGNIKYVRFQFAEPADILLVQVTTTTAEPGPPAFELFGHVAHAIVPRDRSWDTNQVSMGRGACGTNVPLAQGESATLHFAAMTYDGRVSEWSEPHSDTVPSGCSVIGPLGGASSQVVGGGALAAVFAVSLLRRRNRRE